MSTQILTASPASVQQSEVGAQFDMIKHHQELIHTGQFEELGPVWCIAIEASHGAAVPAKAVTNAVGVRLDFPGLRKRDGLPLGPRLAKSRCVHCNTLLLLDPIRRQDGNVGLEDIPDPRWVPPIHQPTKAELAGKATYTPPTAPLIPQRLAERARGQWPKGNGEFLCFSPIHQVLFRLTKPVDGNPNMPAREMDPYGYMAYCGTDREGRQMEMVISQKTGEAYFLYGKFEIYRCG